MRSLNLNHPPATFANSSSKISQSCRALYKYTFKGLRWLYSLFFFDEKSPVSRNAFIQMSNRRNIFKTINISCDRKELSMILNSPLFYITRMFTVLSITMSGGALLSMPSSSSQSSSLQWSLTIRDSRSFRWRLEVKGDHLDSRPESPGLTRSWSELVSQFSSSNSTAQSTLEICSEMIIFGSQGDKESLCPFYQGLSIFISLSQVYLRSQVYLSSL